MTVPENVTVIPATRAIGTQTKTNTMQKTRVAAYCRVSTEFEEQESSYEMQVEHYTNYIQSKPEWELVEVYVRAFCETKNTAVMCWQENTTRKAIRHTSKKETTERRTNTSRQTTIKPLSAALCGMRHRGF